MTFYTDYEEARRDAQSRADDTGLLLRLRRVDEYGRDGYVFNFVPARDRQFGRDLEGELIEPTLGTSRRVCRD